MITTAKHRSTWTAERFSADIRQLGAVATGKRVDLTKGVRK
jgi:hypothetical protein